MSRIGLAPITIPDKVEVDIASDNGVTVKGPKGELMCRIDRDMKVALDDGVLTISRPTNQKRHKAAHGLSRSLIDGMITGVSEGYKKQLELIGVGYRATHTGQLLELSLGFSHPIMFAVPEEVKVTAETEKGKAPTITLESPDKQLLGQIAAKIRDFRPPEPYKGKGIRYKGEYIRRKAGKTAATA